ncbi:28371_t:CDS:2 [Dentiscutata erythropus]|uniref:28371_t:CDS:1 n=1 Tax=Dentiscutata erythropus TaxID=1348616 RepID=A0A9N9NLH8_9GLOM|nr:28371_t:CDS:2 [Dentiscutata erythropus]
MAKSNVNNIPIPDNSGATSSCNSQLFNDTESGFNIFIYYDIGANYTDGTVPDQPTGVNFQISANNSFPDDSLPTLLSYPILMFIDQDLVTSVVNQPGSKFADVFASDSTNEYVLSPYQRQVLFFDRVLYSQLDPASKRGVLSVAKKSKKLAFTFFGLSSRLQNLSPLNPQTINPSLFTATLEVYNQSSTLTSYKETE